MSLLNIFRICISHTLGLSQQNSSRQFYGCWNWYV